MSGREKQPSFIDILCFLNAWISDPACVGAVAPSSGALAELIASEITPISGTVVELGPGTGVFTRAVLGRGVSEEKMTLIESLPEFAELLRRRFPKARVLCMDAARLRERSLFEEACVGAVISGLPLLNMSPRKIISILRGTFCYMNAQGAFYQFTYGPRCPVPRALLDRLGLRATRLGCAVFNFPPATVYRITRKRRSRLALA